MQNEFSTTDNQKPLPLGLGIRLLSITHTVGWLQSQISEALGEAGLQEGYGDAEAGQELEMASWRLTQLVAYLLPRLGRLWSHL